MNKIKLKTEGLEGDTLKFAVELNEAFDALPGSATKADIDAAIDAYKAANPIPAAEVTKAQYDDLLEQVKQLKEREMEATGKGKTIKQAVKAQATELKGMMKASPGQEVELKANTTRASVDATDQGIVLPGIGQLIRVARSTYDVCRKVSFPVGQHSGTIRYLDWDEATTVKAAAMIAEGSTFPESTAKWKRYTIELKKVGDTLPVTEEFFEDEAMAAAELESFLSANVESKIDDQVMNGDGTGDNLTGLLASISAYSATASGIVDANIYDLAMKVKTAINKPAGNKYNADTIIMNSDTRDRLVLKKDENNQYLFPAQHPIYSMIVEDNTLADNVMVVGDRRYMTIYELGGMTLGKWMVNDQFNKDMLTIKARKRLLFLIKNSDKSGFRKVTDITAALVTLAS